MRTVLHAAIAAAICVAFFGCSSTSDSSGLSALTTAPTAGLTTDTFSGTIDVGGTDFHPFTVTSSGNLNVTLTAAGPPATIFMGLGIGTPAAATATAAASCPLIANASLATPAGTAAQLSGTISPGSYCVSVFDVGNQTTQIAYTVTVSHP
jgi:hypothetical protein